MHCFTSSAQERMGLPVLTSPISRPEILSNILNALARSHSGNHVALDVKDAEAWVESRFLCQKCNDQFQSQNHLLVPVTSITKPSLSCRAQTWLFLKRQSLTIHSLPSIVILKKRADSLKAISNLRAQPALFVLRTPAFSKQSAPVHAIFQALAAIFKPLKA